jgi:hypothetical protein
LVRAFDHRLRRRFEDFRRPAEIRKALPQVHGIMLGGERGHALEHAGVHLFVQWVHRASA